jgi:hypothetical protein
MRRIAMTAAPASRPLSPVKAARALVAEAASTLAGVRTDDGHGDHRVGLLRAIEASWGDVYPDDDWNSILPIRQRRSTLAGELLTEMHDRGSWLEGPVFDLLAQIGDQTADLAASDASNARTPCHRDVALARELSDAAKRLQRIIDALVTIHLLDEAALAAEVPA